MGLDCFESSGEEHVSFHIIFLAFSSNLHRFTCHVENTSFHFFCKHTPVHLRTKYMYVHIYYVLSEGSEDPSEIFFGPILGQFFWGKKIAITYYIYRII